MSTASAIPVQFPDSDYEDGIYYPSSDGKPMAETGIHVNALLMLFHLLNIYYKDRSDVLITGNQFWYWEKGNPKARRAPDVMVVAGVPKEPPRRSYRMWLEGNTLPAAIFEMSSRKTIEKDLGVKFQLYERLGVHEYFMFDPDRRVLRPALQGYRLAEGKYQQIPMIDETLESDLGLRFRIEGQILRLSDRQSGKPVLFPSEEATLERERAEEAVRQAELESHRAEEAVRQAELESHRAEEAVRQAELESERNKTLAAEIERLRNEVARLKGGQP
jgi:Uma2 family endonuclease